MFFRSLWWEKFLLSIKFRQLDKTYRIQKDKLLIHHSQTGCYSFQIVSKLLFQLLNLFISMNIDLQQMFSLCTALDFYTEPVRLIENGHKRGKLLWVVYFILSRWNHYHFAEIRLFLNRWSNFDLLEHVSAWSTVSIGEYKPGLSLITAWQASFLYDLFQSCTTLSVLVRGSTYTWLIQLKIIASPRHWSRSILFAIPFHHQFVKVLFKKKRRSVVKSWWLYLHWCHYSPRF